MAFVANYQRVTAHGGGLKLSAQNLKGHVDRDGKYATADNIDSSRTDKNYKLDNWDSNISFEERAEALKTKKQIELGVQQRKTRTDAILFGGLVITASNEEMKKIEDEGRLEEFFETAKAELDDYFGEENLIYGNVHLDEKTPHLHIGYTVLSETTGNIHMREKVNKNTLGSYFQKELPKKMREHGFDVAMPQNDHAKQKSRVEPIVEEEVREELQVKYTFAKKKLKKVNSEIDDAEKTKAELEEKNRLRIRSIKESQDALRSRERLVEAREKEAEEKIAKADEMAHRASQSLSERKKLSEYIDVFLNASGLDEKSKESIRNGVPRHAIHPETGEPMEIAPEALLVAHLKTFRPEKLHKAQEAVGERQVQRRAERVNKPKSDDLEL